MGDLKSSMQFHSDTIDEVETKVSQVYVFNDESVKTLIYDNKNLHLKVRGLKDRSRRNNLRFDGLWQPQGKDWYGSEEKLGIKKKEMTIAKFLNYKDEEKVL